MIQRRRNMQGLISTIANIGITINMFLDSNAFDVLSSSAAPPPVGNEHNLTLTQRSLLYASLMFLIPLISPSSRPAAGVSTNISGCLKKILTHFLIFIGIASPIFINMRLSAQLCYIHCTQEKACELITHLCLSDKSNNKLDNLLCHVQHNDCIQNISHSPYYELMAAFQSFVCFYFFTKLASYTGRVLGVDRHDGASDYLLLFVKTAVFGTLCFAMYFISSTFLHDVAEGFQGTAWEVMCSPILQQGLDKVFAVVTSILIYDTFAPRSFRTGIRDMIEEYRIVANIEKVLASLPERVTEESNRAR